MVAERSKASVLRSWMRSMVRIPGSPFFCLNDPKKSREKSREQDRVRQERERVTSKRRERRARESDETGRRTW